MLSTVAALEGKGIAVPVAVGVAGIVAVLDVGAEDGAAIDAEVATRTGVGVAATASVVVVKVDVDPSDVLVTARLSA